MEVASPSRSLRAACQPQFQSTHTTLWPSTRLAHHATSPCLSPTILPSSQLKHVSRRPSAVVAAARQGKVLISQQAAIDRDLRLCTSLSSLLQLVEDHVQLLNEVNVFTATTTAHKLLRSVPDAAQLISCSSPASQLVHHLIPLSIQQAARFSPRHCVSILTAHAWMKPMLQAQLSTPLQTRNSQQGSETAAGLVDSQMQQARDPYSTPTWHKLCQALCDTLVASQSITKSADLSRAVWAIAKLRHHHEGLMDAASHAVLRSALIVDDRQYHHGQPGTPPAHTHVPDATKGDDSPSSQSRASHISSHVSRPTSAGVHSPHSLASHASIGANDGHAASSEQLCAAANLVWALGQLMAVGPGTQLDLTDPPTHHMTMKSQPPAFDSHGASSALLHRVLINECDIQAGSTSWLNQLQVQDSTNMLHGMTHFVRCASRPSTSIETQTEHQEWGQVLPAALLSISSWVTRTCRDAHGLGSPGNGTLSALDEVPISGPQQQAASSPALHNSKAIRARPLPPHVLATLAWSISQMSEVCVSIALSERCQVGSGGGREPGAQHDVRAVMNSVVAAMAAVTGAAVQAGTWSRMTPRDMSQILGAAALIEQLQAKVYGAVLPPASNPHDQPAPPHPEMHLSSNKTLRSAVSRMARFVAREGHTCGPQDLCEIAFTFSHFCAAQDDSHAGSSVGTVEEGQLMRLEVQKCLPALAAAAAPHAAQMPADSLVSLMGSLVHLGHVPEALLAVVEARARVARDEVDGSCDSRDEVYSGTQLDRLDLVDDLTPAHAASLCWVVAVAAQSSREWQPKTWFLEQLEEAVSLHVPDMDNQRLVICLWSLARLDASCTNTLRVAAPLLLSRMPPRTTASAPTARRAGSLATQPLTPTQLVTSVWSISRIMAGPQHVMLQDMTPLQLLQQAGCVLCGSLHQLNGVSLAMIAAAYAAAQVHPGEALLKALSGAAASKASGMDARSLSVLTWGLSHYQVRSPQLLSLLADSLLAGMQQQETHRAKGSDRQALLAASSTPAAAAHSTQPSLAAGAAQQGSDAAAAASGSWDEQLNELAPPLRPAAQARPGAGRAGLAGFELVSEVSSRRVDVVVGMAVSLGKARVHHPALLETALHLLTSQVDAAGGQQAGPGNSSGAAHTHLTAKQAICMLWALAAVKHRCTAQVLNVLMGCVGSELLPGSGSNQPAPRGQVPGKRRRKQLLDVRLLAMLFQALPNLRYQPDPGLLAAMCSGLLGRAASLSSHSLCQITWSLASLRWHQSDELLDEMFDLLTQRIIINRQELLTLPSMLKLAWSMAYFKQFRRPLFKHAAANALRSPPTMFLNDPNMMRLLIEVKLLSEREGRSDGLWRGLARGWQQRVQRGGPDSLPATWIMQGYGVAANSAFSQVVKHLPVLLARGLRLPGARWLASPQGELSCCFTCSADQLMASAPAGASHPISPAVNQVYLELSACKHPATSGVMMAQGPMRDHAVVSVAVVVLAPWHLTVNSEVQGAVMSHALVHMRLLVRQGCLVVCVPLEELVQAAQEQDAVGVVSAYVHKAVTEVGLVEAPGT